MTEQERDELLQRLDERTERTERKVDRLLDIAQGQGAARVTTDERLSVLERRVADLERKAG